MVNAVIENTVLLYQNDSNPSVWRCSERSVISNKILLDTLEITQPTGSKDVRLYICEQYKVGLLGHFIHQMSKFQIFFTGGGWI